MTPDQIAAFKVLEKAQQALKRGERHLARQYAEQALRLAPELEEPWLMMAALATPRGSVAFLERALQINPQSERAQKGMLWAGERYHKEPPRQSPPIEKTTQVPVKATAVTVPVAVPAQNAKTAPVQVKKSGSRSRSLLVVLFIVLCLAAAGFILMSATPVAAFISNNIFPGQQKGPSWAQVDFPKPTYTLTASPTWTVPPTFTFTPTSTSTSTPTASSTPSPTPTRTLTPLFTGTPLPTETPTFTPTDLPSSTHPPTDSVSPTPLPTDTAAPLPTQPILPTPPSGVSGGVHWIDVDLTNQMAYAYEGKTIVNSFIVSTGTAKFRTVTGSYHIYEKHITANMWGPGYFLPDVPYTMYFHKGYALHGTYWHSNFGTPMSHGCVNLSIPDAEWLYHFATIGTLVRVHY